MAELPPETITPQDVRGFANLPSEVPDSLLQRHLDIAARDLVQRIGADGPNEELEKDWDEALTVRALASVFPWLHTFSLSGAAKVGRLEGSVEYRFLDADDVDAAVANLDARFDVLTSRIKSALETDDEDTSAGFGSLGMIAI